MSLQPMQFPSKVLFLAIVANESAGVPAFAATDAVQTRNLSVSIYEGSTVSLDVDRDSLGGQAQINTNPQRKFDFEVFAAGSGTVGDAPAYGKILRACGLREVIDPGVSVSYDPVSGGYEMLAAAMHRPDPKSGQRQIYESIGLRGNVELDISAGQLPVFKFSSLLGTWEDPYLGAAVVKDTSGYKEPIPATKDNTPIIRVDGYDSVLHAFNLNAGWNVSRGNRPGQAETFLSERGSSGSITILAPSLDDKDYFAKLKSHEGVSYLPIEIEHGKTAGNILNVSLPKVQITSINETDVDGQLAYQIDYSAIPTDAGDDEFLITFK